MKSVLDEVGIYVCTLYSNTYRLYRPVYIYIKMSISSKMRIRVSMGYKDMQLNYTNHAFLFQCLFADGENKKPDDVTADTTHSSTDIGIIHGNCGLKLQWN